MTPEEHLNDTICALNDALSGLPTPQRIPGLTTRDGLFAEEGYLASFCWCEKPWCAFCAFNAPEARIPLSGRADDTHVYCIEASCYKHWRRSFEAWISRMPMEHDINEKPEILPLFMEHAVYARERLRSVSPAFAKAIAELEHKEQPPPVVKLTGVASTISAIARDTP